jgi:multidrug efflux pump subunit AcrA (membrane-fusion protein)
LRPEREEAPESRVGPFASLLGPETFFDRIADLRRVWILADVFGPEAEYIRPGMVAHVSLPGRRRSFDARVSSDVLPQFDATSQSVKVRLEADNPGSLLRPDMFVDVDLVITLPPTIAVSADAVLDTGLKKTVFVERSAGVFEPRAVETGWRFGGRVEIVNGLIPGDRIVVSGTFLLDSESRMRHIAPEPGSHP